MFKKSLVFSLVTILAQGPAFGAPIYYLQDLQTLGGPTSHGMAINDVGQAVGYSTLPGGQTRAFLWEEGPGMQNIGTNAGGGDSYAYDINNAGQIVGQATNQAFRYSEGTIVNIDGANLGLANDLDENGNAVGTRNVSPPTRAIRWSPTNTVSSPYPASNLTGVATNNLGQFVGTAGAGGGYYSNNGAAPFQNLGTLIPTDINDSRLITGSIGDTAVVHNLDTNTTTLIPKIGSLSELARALGINEAGTVVGESGDRGFVFYNNSELVDITANLHSSFTGWEVLTVNDININGLMIGTARFNGGPEHAVIIRVPEPAQAPFLIMLLFLLFLHVSVDHRLISAHGHVKWVRGAAKNKGDIPRLFGSTVARSC